MRCLKILELEPPYDPAIPLLGIYLKKSRTLTGKYICIPMFIAAFFTVVKTWKQPKCPWIDEWIKKMLYIYTTDYYTQQLNEILPVAATWVGLL